MMRKCLLILPLAILDVACSNFDDVREPTPIQGLEIVTYMGPVAEGTAFMMQRTEKSEALRLLDPRQLQIENLEKGRRILLEYTAEVNDTVRRPVPIIAHKLYYINFDTVRWMPRAEIMTLPTAQATIISSWRTGNYINLQTTLTYDGQPAGFTLVGDEATKEAPIAELYLCRTGTPAGEASVQRRTLGSFFCPGLRSYRLHTLHAP